MLTAAFVYVHVKRGDSKRDVAFHGGVWGTFLAFNALTALVALLDAIVTVLFSISQTSRRRCGARCRGGGEGQWFFASIFLTLFQPYITALLEDPSTFRKLVSPPRLCALAVALPSAHLLWVYSLARVCDLSWGNRVGIDVLFRAASLGGVRRSTTSRVLRSLGLLPSPKKQRQASPLQPPPESPPSRVAQSSRFLGRAISPTLRRSDTERPSPRLGKSAIEKPQSDAGKGLFFKFAGQEGHGAADEDAGDEYGVGLTDLDAAVDENALEKADKGAEESPKKTKHDEEDLAQARWLYDQTSKWAVANAAVLACTVAPLMAMALIADDVGGHRCGEACDFWSARCAAQWFLRVSLAPQCVLKAVALVVVVYAKAKKCFGQAKTRPRGSLAARYGASFLGTP
mmetsp:Transcript_17278/g.61445  ORF Transcript_17278/g.61445 Transcript_17278/m.61445 type:complete len:400 (-) Transcript_17278:26-1225(-)